jgi:hypothetical protein
MSITIEKPVFLNATRVSIAKIPNRILAIIRRRPCKLLRSNDHHFYLVTSSGESLGEFTVHREGLRPSQELLKFSTPTTCAPIVDNVSELHFKVTFVPKTYTMRPPQKTIVPVTTSKGNLRVWSESSAFQTLTNLRDRFYDATDRQRELLLEMRATLAREGPQINKKFMKETYTNVMALRDDQEECMQRLKRFSDSIRSEPNQLSD